jgi:hypothetical protein
MLSVF